MIGRPCVTCGRRTNGSSYCRDHAERERDRRQPYRVAYRSSVYRRARRERFRLAGGRCEAIVEGRRCELAAVEAHHLIPLSSATTLAAAVELCSVENLRAVCFGHNPRGSGS